MFTVRNDEYTITYYVFRFQPSGQLTSPLHCPLADWGSMLAYDQMAVSSVIIRDTRMRKDTNSCT